VHRLGDPAEFGVAVSGAILSADFLARQTTPAIIEQFQSPGWALDFHKAGVKARICGPLSPEWASLGLMRTQTESWFHGFLAQPGVLVCNPPGEGIDGRIAPGFESAAVNVPRELWEQCRVLAGVERPTFGSVKAHRLAPQVYTRIELRMQAVRQMLKAAESPAAMRLASHEATAFTIEVATLAWQLSAVPEPPRNDSPRNRARLARRAETWMRTHLAESVQIPDACLALRVSRRELEYAFRWSFDTSPRDFLQALRLNAIRKALQNGAGEEESVSRVALDHGITHFGRFSAQYRELFGEKPSETSGTRIRGQ
jgi:AraC family ethanolamine operon transcriptional activator